MPGHSCAMTFTLMLILNVVLDATILAALAFVISRAAKLTPHRVGVTQPARPSAAGPEGERARRTLSRLRPLLD
jgi:hypothetical protein